jgi:hypothetical protein
MTRSDAFSIVVGRRSLVQFLLLGLFRFVETSIGAFVTLAAAAAKKRQAEAQDQRQETPGFAVHWMPRTERQRAGHP